MVDETWTAKLYLSLKMLTGGRSSHARAAKDVTLQDATESTQGPREAQKNEMIEEKLIQEECLKRTEKLHIQDKART